MRKAKTFWSHWGLRKNPFGNIESANEVFESNEMMRVMDHLAEAIEEGGIYSVSGERGIGKTTAKNEIIQYLKDSPRYAVSVMESMDMSLVRMTTIHAALVMDLSNEKPSGFAEHRTRQVRRLLGELTASGKSVVLIIDEAQNLRFTTMESLKMLTEMRWALLARRLISILLFGQPTLDARLARDEGLMLRVTPFRMKGLTTDEVLQYIDVRCRAAGGNMTTIFNDDVLAYIAEHQHSPLHVNGVCSQCMRAARNAGEMKVTVEMVYASGGIRTPRTILRENDISIHKFAKMIHVHHMAVEKLLDGNDAGVSNDLKDKFRAGMSGIQRPEAAEETLETQAG